MRRHHFVSVFVIFCFCVKGCVTTFFVTPSNIAANVGDNIVLRCTSDNYQRWLFSNFNPSFVGLCFATGACTDNPAFNVANAGNVRDLSRNSVQMGEAGEFYCREIPGPQNGASLVVVGPVTCGTSPITVQDGDTVSITCSVTYNGLVSPSMNWVRDSVVTMNNPTDSVVQPYVSVSNTLTVTASTSLPGSRYDCNVYFQAWPALANHASNIPTLTKTCSVIINVAPKVITTTPPAPVTTATTTATTSATTTLSTSMWNNLYLIPIIAGALTIAAALAACCYRFRRSAIPPPLTDPTYQLQTTPQLSNPTYQNLMTSPSGFPYQSLSVPQRFSVVPALQIKRPQFLLPRYSLTTPVTYVKRRILPI